MVNLQKRVKKPEIILWSASDCGCEPFLSDTDAEIALLQAEASQMSATAIVCKHWEKGGLGGKHIVTEVLKVFESTKKTGC